MTLQHNLTSVITVLLDTSLPSHSKKQPLNVYNYCKAGWDNLNVSILPTRFVLPQYCIS